MATMFDSWNRFQQPRQLLSSSHYYEGERDEHLLNVIMYLEPMCWLDGCLLKESEEGPGSRLNIFRGHSERQNKVVVTCSSL